MVLTYEAYFLKITNEYTDVVAWTSVDWDMFTQFVRFEEREGALA